MKILVVGDCLMKQAIARALHNTHNSFACGNTGKQEMWVRYWSPELVLVDTAGMGMAGLQVFRELQALGYKGLVSFTQSEGMYLPVWAQAPITEGLVHGVLQVPWTPQDILSWFENMTLPSR